jgi:D-aminoacyl-tRNA deacylase
MRALVQRVSSASVEIERKTVGEIGVGLLVLVGIAREDEQPNVEKLAEKLLNYRIFPDESARMNLSLKDSGGELLIVSQFTLCADTSKGLRPGFSSAASPELAEDLYQDFVAYCRNQISCVQTGSFGADMQVSLVNDGPVTFMLES